MKVSNEERFRPTTQAPSASSQIDALNSLLRPALYGAWHAIHNLTRTDQPPESYVHVVGPICETGDFLARDRVLPPLGRGDLVAVFSAGMLMFYFVMLGYPRRL